MLVDIDCNRSRLAFAFVSRGALSLSLSWMSVCLVAFFPLAGVREGEVRSMGFGREPGCRIITNSIRGFESPHLCGYCGYLVTDLSTLLFGVGSSSWFVIGTCMANVAMDLST